MSGGPIKGSVCAAVQSVLHCRLTLLLLQQRRLFTDEFVQILRRQLLRLFSARLGGLFFRRAAAAGTLLLDLRIEG